MPGKGSTNKPKNEQMTNENEWKKKSWMRKLINENRKPMNQLESQ